MKKKEREKKAPDNNVKTIKERKLSKGVFGRAYPNANPGILLGYFTYPTFG